MIRHPFSTILAVKKGSKPCKCLNPSDDKAPNNSPLPQPTSNIEVSLCMMPFNALASAELPNFITDGNPKEEATVSLKTNFFIEFFKLF